MAKSKGVAADAGGTVEARVLIAGAFGAPNDVASVTEEEAKAGVEAGVLDCTPEAVTYAKTLVLSDEA